MPNMSMPTLSADDLRHIAGGRSRPDIVAGIAAALPSVCAEFEISSPRRLAHFLAQCCHESDHFSTLVEYASGAAYEGRRDLGNLHPGDGRLYKGRGEIQETGRANYTRDGHALGLDLVDHPQWAADPAIGLRLSGHYWKTRGLNAKADQDDGTKLGRRRALYACTRGVNGGLNGIVSRSQCLDRAWAVIERTMAPGAPVALFDGDAAPDGPPMIGDTGDAVREAQGRLRTLGYPVGAVDGIFGAATHDCVCQFQRHNGIDETGALDDVTVRALFLAPGKPVDDARADASADDLRAAGSQTVAAADKIGTVAKVTMGAGAAAPAAEAASQSDVMRDMLGRASDAKDAASTIAEIAQWAMSHWWIGAILAGVSLWMWKGQIIERRLADHRAGLHMGR